MSENIETENIELPLRDIVEELKDVNKSLKHIAELLFVKALITTPLNSISGSTNEFTKNDNKKN